MRSPRFAEGPAAVDMAVAVESKLAAARRSPGASCMSASGRVACAKEATTSRARSWRNAFAHPPAPAPRPTSSPCGNMSKIFKPHGAVTCFFCQSAVTPPPRNPRSFRCPHCDCWNRFDAKGEIVSDEPAMHDENLNTKSFARRGEPYP